MKISFTIVIDTNVVLAAQGDNARSPGKEIFERWADDQFKVLYSEDIIDEYVEKIIELKASEEEAVEFALNFMERAEEIFIEYYHFEKYPEDHDDTAFILCAYNGDATHLISYDPHLLDIDEYFDFRICKPVPFLKELRQELGKP